MPRNDISSLFSGNDSDELIASLEQDLHREKDGRREDRFIALLIGTILLNVHFFTVFEGWGGPIALTILEIFLFIVLAQRLGVDVLAVWLDKALSSLSNGTRGGD